jgi:hypothetical protein
MLGLNVARIPFNVRMTEGLFRGEVIGIGDELKDGCIFEVRMANGEMFYLKAEPDYELRRYNWTSIAYDKVKRLVPMIGRVIERYFSGK